MKTCVSSYSFSQYMQRSGANQLDLIVLAKEMGFDAIEMTDLDAPDGMTKQEFASLLREESERLSLPIVNYTIGADLLNAPDPDAESERLYALPRRSARSACVMTRPAVSATISASTKRSTPRCRRLPTAAGA